MTTEGRSNSEPSPPILTWLLVGLFAGSLFLFRLGEARTFTGHEGLVAQIAREMTDTGDWLVPRIAGQPWLEKPPLPHWTVALVASATGTLNEFTARLPSVLAALIGIFVIMTWTVRWFGPGRGLLTGLILATSYYVVTYARLAEADIYLWTLIIGSLAAFAGDWVAAADAPPCPNAARRWVFFTLLGLTQLTKGPLFGAVLVLLPCLVWLVGAGYRNAFITCPSDRTFPKLLTLVQPLGWFLHPGLVLGLGLAMTWPVWIALRYPEAGNLWWMHTVGRLGGTAVLNPAPWWYYLTTLPWQLAPWTPVVLLGMFDSLRRAVRFGNPPDRFLWLWFASHFLFLSAVSAKHHHYLIHALPPCALWAALGLEHLAQRMTAWAVSWYRSLTAQRSACPLLLVGGFGVAAVMAAGIAAFPAKCPYAEDALVLGGLAILAGVALMAALLRGSPAAAGAVLFATLWLAYGWMHFSIMGKSDGYRRETEFLTELDRWVAPEQTIYVLGLEPSRLLFYSPRRLEVHVRPQEIAEAARRTAPRASSDQPLASLVLTSRGHEPQLRKYGEAICVVCMEPPRSGKSDPFRELALYRVTWKAAKIPRSKPRETAFGNSGQNPVAGP